MWNFFYVSFYVFLFWSTINSKIWLSGVETLCANAHYRASLLLTSSITGELFMQTSWFSKDNETTNIIFLRISYRSGKLVLAEENKICIKLLTPNWIWRVVISIRGGSRASGWRTLNIGTFEWPFWLMLSH